MYFFTQGGGGKENNDHLTRIEFRLLLVSFSVPF
jgi:hypothetical protein